jgi:hypothetical protein
MRSVNEPSKIAALLLFATQKSDRKEITMRSRTAHRVLTLCLLGSPFLTACNKESAGRASGQSTTAALVRKPIPVTAPKVQTDLSDRDVNDQIEINRLANGSAAMDAIDANPVGTDSSKRKDGANYLALCNPRFTDSNISQLAKAEYPTILSAYPWILTAGSEVLVHRDTGLAPKKLPYVLLACASDPNQLALSSHATADGVQIVHLQLGDTATESIAPYPTKQESELSLLVICDKRITDSNFGQLHDVAYPIQLSQGSQLAIRHDPSIKTEPTVVILSCE